LDLNNPSLVTVSLVVAIAIFVPTSNLMTSNVQGQEQERVNATILFDSTNLGYKAYEPNPIELLVLGSVSWTNDDRIAHSVTAIEGEFDSGIMQPDETFDYTFGRIGDFDYYCMLHPSMVGRVVVR
jgi:plastocyanin